MAYGSHGFCVEMEQRVILSFRDPFRSHAPRVTSHLIVFQARSLSTQVASVEHWILLGGFEKGWVAWQWESCHQQDNLPLPPSIATPTLTLSTLPCHHPSPVPCL